jgi:exodeoxyribonuclease VII large subunit
MDGFHSPLGSEERPLRVSELNRSVRSMLESEWSGLWVEGELSNVTRSAAGHVYFTVNDEIEKAQLSGVIFRGDAQRSRVALEEGARVRLRGRLSLYEPRGRFQFIARVARAAGQGDLQAQFNLLKQKLQAEGLFAADRKRDLPRMPRTVGVVTSSAGAALHDIIRVARGRCPTRLVVADCRVQGSGSAESIVNALLAVQELEDLDLVILSRGGGSAEDLWAFNDEHLAREIANCRVPVVSGVGHEVDFTIADFVADARAATPSNAAEISIPDQSTLRADLDRLTDLVARAMQEELDAHRMELERLQQRLDDPRLSLRPIHDRLNMLRRRLERFAASDLRGRRAALQSLRERVDRQDVRLALSRGRGRHSELQLRLNQSIGPRLRSGRFRFETLMQRLDALSPLKVLGRGYAIVLHEESGLALRKPSGAEIGDHVKIRLADGQLRAQVVSEDS